MTQPDWDYVKKTTLWTYEDLLGRVASREQCAVFVEQGVLDFEQLIQVLNYLLRWALPFYTASRELLDHDDKQEMAAYALLKQHRLMCSFDLLEQGRTDEMRLPLARRTGLSLDFISALVHRADLARLPYVRRKTILPLCGAGYTTLARVAAADLAQMEADMEGYFRALGKDWTDYKSVIVLRLMVAWAQALPPIIV